MGRRAVELEPLSANAHVNATWPYFFVPGHLKEAVDGFRRAVHVDPNATYALWSLGLACQMAGVHEEGLAALERLVAHTNREMPWALALHAASLAAAGRVAEARKLLAELEDTKRLGYVPPLHLAFVRIALGEKEETLNLLERALEERNALFWAWARTSPVFESLRDDSRFQKIVASIRPA